MKTVFMQICTAGTLVVRDYSDLPISYGYSCSADAGAQPYRAVFCEIVGNNEQEHVNDKKGSLAMPNAARFPLVETWVLKLRVL